MVRYGGFRTSERFAQRRFFSKNFLSPRSLKNPERGVSCFGTKYCTVPYLPVPLFEL